MSLIQFSGLIIAGLLILFIFNRNRIINYYGKNFALYFCLCFLLISILGFSNRIQIILRLFSVVLSWGCILQHGFTLRLKRNNGATILIIYAFVCAISTAYSVSMAQTAFKSLEVITDIVLIWRLYSLESEHDFARKTLDTIMYVCSILLAVTMSGFFLVPSFFANTGYSASRTVLGIRIGDGLVGANMAGAMAVLCFAWVVLLKYKKNLSTFALLGLYLLTMLYSQSRSSLVLVPVIIFLRLFKPKARYKIFYFLIVAIGIGIAFANVDLIYTYLLRGQNSTDIASASGRLMMWGYAFEYIKKNPLIGYGFGAGGEMVGKVLPGAFNGFQHMHNGVVETLLGTGAIGLTLLFLQVVVYLSVLISSTFKRGLKSNLFDYILLLYFIIRTVSSLGIGNWQSIELIIWIYMVIVAGTGKTVQWQYVNFSEN